MSARHGRVLHTGQAIVDIVMRVGAMPPVGGDVYASQFAFATGGGFNVMAAAARDGADVVYLGTVGSGPFGQTVRAALADEGIAVPNAPVAAVDTGFSVTIVDDDAERTFVSALGAEGRVLPEHLAAVDVRPDDIVYVTGYSLRHEVNRASLAGWLPGLDPRVTVVFDPSPLLAEIPDEVWAVIVARATVWSLNAREARIALARLAGPGADGSGADGVAAALAGRLHATVLVRDGARGTDVADATGVRHVPALPVTPVDTNGAGDAHTGVLMAALAHDPDVLAAVRRANVAAAVAVTREGPATSPRADEIDATLATAPRV